MNLPANNLPTGALDPGNTIEMLTCPACDGEGYNMPYLASDCCGVAYHEPGWPDNNICSSCKEHSEPCECFTCEGRKKVPQHEYDLYMTIEE